MVHLESRDDLAKYFAEQNFNLGAEIGVASGNYSVTLLRANPNLKLYCIDLWGPGSSRNEARYTREYAQAKAALEPLNAVMIRKPSVEAAKDFEHDTLDFVYIDAAHTFDNVMRDIIEWAGKVRRGGIIAGHDYGNSKHNGVKDAVLMYAKWHNKKVNVLPVPDHVWTPRDPSDEIAGLSWWIRK